MLTELRLALRSIRRTPFSAMGAVLMLAVGIGISLIAFATLDGFLWRPLPYPEADRLVGIARTNPPLWNKSPIADVASVELARRHITALDEVAVAREQRVHVRTAAGTLTRTATWATPNAFEMLAVPAIIGRPPRSVVGVDGAPEVAVGESFWRNYLGGVPEIIGTTLVIDGTPATIVGIMPAGVSHRSLCSLTTSAPTAEWLAPLWILLSRRG